MMINVMMIIVMMITWNDDHLMISRTGNQPALDVDALLRHQQVQSAFCHPFISG